MERNYKLSKIKELSENDQDFILGLVAVFLEEVPADILLLKEAILEQDFQRTYQIAHKLKPTIDLFQLDTLGDLLEIEHWGRDVLKSVDILPKLEKVMRSVELAMAEMKADFKL
ncbi:Hpt domain-containing protein [Algibacter pacificus]|uniref:Hpt domain-containing protein n=1 Tax=Algibacter pacificus TaxID=2599389 RepID=UPI0011C8934F|nr:Hpt domain-containing protein [Algibacter pacificus]